MKFVATLALWLLIISTVHCARYIFAGWSQPCKSGLDGSVVHPHDECEVNKGMLCQVYDQGEYCGCQIRSFLTYDRTSKECRRRMGAICYPPFSPQEDQVMPFNAKCHENAYCAEINDTVHARLVSAGELTSKYRYACLCRPNFHYKLEMEDFEGCFSKNWALVSVLPDKALLYITAFLLTAKIYI